ncbi:MAG: ABC transporter permease [Acidobacteriaceae bacterium]
MPTLFPTFFKDLRYALRKLRHSPGFAFTAIVTLALGIGANVVVFSVLNSLVLRPMNFPDAKRVFTVQPNIQGDLNLSYPDYRDLRDRNTTFSALAADRVARVGLETSSGAQPVWGYEVSGNYFGMLGVQPYLGRFIQPADDRSPGASAYVVLSYNCWHNRFGGDKNIVGRTIHLNKAPYLVLGVAPKGFQGTERFFGAEVWVPVTNEKQIEGYDWLTTRGNHGLWAIGRLKPSVTPQQAQDNLNAIAKQLQKEYPATDGRLGFRLTRPGLLGDALDGPVHAFLFAVMLLAGMVLLAACANLGGLFAARTADRARELAIRVAIGAGRVRIFRQLLTESIVLSILGGVAGCAMAVGLLGALNRWQPTTAFPVQTSIQTDFRVYLFAFLVSLLTGVLFGSIPARQIWRTDPNQAIKSGSSAFSDRRSLALRDFLLAGQIAICCLLVTASLVAVRGLQHTLHANLGFNPHGVTTANFDLHMANYSDEDAARFQQRLLDAVSHLPGVTAAAYANTTPLSLDQSDTGIHSVDTAVLTSSNVKFDANFSQVSPGYFKTAETRLLAGRSFTAQDDRKAPPVAIVNRTFARKLFGTDHAVGKYFKGYSGGKPVEIVGVVEDGKYNTVTEDPTAAVFFPILQNLNTETVLLVRSQRDPRDMAASIHNAIRRLDPNLPIFSLGSWQDSLGIVLLPTYAATVALGVFGGLAILLAVTGIFGLASYTVSRRMRELGIRVALGASHRQILGAALRRPIVLLSAGSLVGLAGGIAASRLLASIVYQATPNDPLVLAGVVLTMALVGALATWIPARRVLSVDPTQVLREE